jgi:hypothetical protein
MTQEEIALKIGLDASKFAEGLRLMKGELSSASQHAEHSFMHAQSSARGFHKVIEQLNDSIPGLGTAFTAIANPISATFAGAAIAVGVVRSKLEEFNKDMDKQGAEAAKRMWTIEMFDALEKKIEAAHAKLKNFLRELRPSQTEAAVEAIGGESDPLRRHRQAFEEKTRLASQRDADVNTLRSLQKRKDELQAVIDKSPKLVEEAERQKKFAEETPAHIRSGVAFSLRHGLIKEEDLPPSARREIEELQKAKEADEIRADRVLKQAQERQRNATKEMESLIKRSDELERGIKEKQGAVEKLGKIQESLEYPEWEDMGTPSRRVGSVRISKKVNGQTVYDTGTLTDKGTQADLLNEIKKLTSTVQSGALVTQPRNGE